jgi:hypothetical protein
LYESRKRRLFEELIVHLEQSKDELMSQGISERKAELKAMQLFGIEEDSNQSMKLVNKREQRFLVSSK